MDYNVVLVTVNYRLGPYGFLNAGIQAARGNQGLKDQVQAMRWVKANIAPFGGNPNQVTIFGESAGAMSVAYHLVSPMSKGLFVGAIMQSGVFNSPFTYEKLDGNQVSIRIAETVGCTTANAAQMVACLQSMNLTTQFGTYANALSFSEAPVLAGPSIETFATGANDPEVFLDQDPWAMVKAGNFNKVPVIIGSISNTEVLPTPLSFISNTGNLAYLQQNWDYTIADNLYATRQPAWFEGTQGAKDLFLGGSLTSNSGWQLGWLFTDRIFTHPARVLIAQLSSSVAVYAYNWTYVQPGAPYTAHAGDLQYFWNLNSAYTIAASEIPFSQNVIQAWVNFAKNGNPGNLWGPNTPWVANTVTSPCGAINYASINTVATMQTASIQSQTACNFWISLPWNDPGDPLTCANIYTDILSPLPNILGNLGIGLNVTGLLGGLLG